MLQQWELENQAHEKEEGEDAAAEVINPGKKRKGAMTARVPSQETRTRAREMSSQARDL